MKAAVDVVIAGGGLAGLGLAKQIKMRRPDCRIVVLEKQHFPRPRAIAKVGESTVEIGTRYLSHNLGLQEHLQSQHLLKFGLRVFFGASADDFSQQDELGPSKNFGIPTYQLDRGDLENHLYQQLIDLDVQIIDTANIDNIELGQLSQQISVSTREQSHQFSSRWFIDAAGRASLLKKQLNLAEANAHKANAVWFRIDRRIEIDDWTSSSDWRARCMPEGTRWLSTNHLTGPGYWVWIIPLASGVTSIGIVLDDHALQESGIQCEKTAVAWMQRHHQRCAAAIEGANFLDFVVLKDYSYGCKKLFSDSGWAITGEAGFFADPFYSPGTDFIGIANNYIEEIVCSDLAGEDIRFKTALYEKIFRSIYDNTLSLYVDQYGGFGDRCMMGLKLLWDQSYYWGVLAFLYFQNALTDIQTLRKVNPILQKSQALNQQVQAQFRERARQRLSLPCRGVFLDQYKVPCLRYFNHKMHIEPLSLEGMIVELEASTEKLTELAQKISEILVRDNNGAATTNTDENSSDEILLGNYGKLLTA